MTDPEYDELIRLANLMVGGTSVDTANASGRAINEIIDRRPELLRALMDELPDLEVDLDAARIKLASVGHDIGLLTLAKHSLEHQASVRDDAPRVQYPHRGPAADRNLAGAWLLESVGEVIPLSGDGLEEAIERLRDTFPNGDEESEKAQCRLESFHLLVDVLRTGSYYLLHQRDARDALESDPPTLDAFPPLPFPRMWIEMCGDYNQSVPMMEMNTSDENVGSLRIIGIGISEVVAGRLWDVLIPFFSGSRSEWATVGVRVSPSGIERLVGQPDDVADDAGLRSALDAGWLSVRRLAVGASHLVSARNVPHESVVLPRAQRKRIQRQGGVAPTVYFVNLSASGEREDIVGGTSRTYSVRWLVSGHWRHLDHGRAVCSCCQPGRAARWIHPYVKGPVSAPWKGRQVRVPGPAS